MVQENGYLVEVRTVENLLGENLKRKGENQKKKNKNGFLKAFSVLFSTQLYTMFYSEKNRKKDTMRRYREKMRHSTRKQRRKHKKYGVKRARGTVNRRLANNFGQWKKEKLGKNTERLIFLKEMSRLEKKAARLIQKKWRRYRYLKEKLQTKKMYEAFDSWKCDVQMLASFVNSPLAHLVDCKPMLHQYFYLSDRLWNIPHNPDSPDFFLFIEPTGIGELSLIKSRLDELIDTRTRFHSSSLRVDNNHLNTSRDYEEDAWEKYMNKIV